MKPTLVFLFIFLSGLTLHSQVFTGGGGPLHDDNTLSDYIIDVDTLPVDFLSAAYGLKRVCINLTHSWVSDLDIRLIAPDGTNIMLTATKGDDLDNYEHTCFTMDATTHILEAPYPYTGDFRPFTTLGDANNGSPGTGNWTLRIWDQFAFADSGEMLDWSLEFGEDAAAPFVFDSSFLPIVEVFTDNITIPNEPKIEGTIRVIHNGGQHPNFLSDTSIFESHIAIEVRGASSQGFPKKSFGFETQDEFGEDLEIALLGLPKEEDWILYAPYTDKSMIRDALTYELGRQMGSYAPRTVFVELFLNGDYHGLYCLEEKIKRDKNRVDIAKLDEEDIEGDDLTGGYILKVDRDDGEGTYFVSGYEGTDTSSEIRIVFEDPEGPDLHPLQKDYITGFFHQFEQALYSENFTDPVWGYRRYADVASFVDFFLLSELGHNVDAYRLSTFFYKDRNSRDSLLKMGPLWDFNLAFGNVNYCHSEQYDGWAYDDSGACGNTPLWWPRLLEDPFFRNEVYCRYAQLRGEELSLENIFGYIHQQSTRLSQGIDRNFERWPLLGVYVWPNNFVGQTYPEEVDYLKSWIAGRLSWMDDQLSGFCLTGTSHVPVLPFTISPNPASDIIWLNSEEENLSGKLHITDVAGQVHYATWLNPNDPVNIESLVPGIYIITVKKSDGKIFREKFVRL